MRMEFCVWILENEHDSVLHAMLWVDLAAA